jgi:hypothetical protein
MISCINDGKTCKNKNVTNLFLSFADKPVWSKLETGKIPQPPELFKIIENHMHIAA